MFIALIKLSLFFFKGEPGKPGEQGLMASILIYPFYTKNNGSPGCSELWSSLCVTNMCVT